MEREKIAELTRFRDQMIRVRNDESLIKGVTFNTLAGDIKVEKKETALMLMDVLISDIQKQIHYLMK